MIDRFFIILKQTLIVFLLVVFGLAANYVPQLPSSQTHTAEAFFGGGFSGGALEITQLLNRAILGKNLVENSVNAAANVSNFTKENALDSIAWSIGKRIVSEMVRSTINWINSGFQGKPAFVQDLRGFLTNVADQVAGEFIRELGSVGSFICSPFRLDVQVALATQYQRGRDGISAPACTASGIVDNIRGFIDGAEGRRGGLNEWLQVTSAPETYTPYGAVLSAELALRSRLINAQGDELSLLNFGNGFLSSKVCDTVTTPEGQTRETNCRISTPGATIGDRLTESLGLGEKSLIEADEINEIVGALLGQLAKKAIVGAAGILGLSSNTNFSGYGSSSYLDRLVDESNDIAGRQSTKLITETIRIEQALYEEALFYRGVFIAAGLNTTAPLSDRRTALATAVDINTYITRASSTDTSILPTLKRLNQAYEATNNYEDKLSILEEYNEITFLNDGDVGELVSGWHLTTIENAINTEQSLTLEQARQIIANSLRTEQTLYEVALRHRNVFNQSIRREIETYITRASSTNSSIIPRLERLLQTYETASDATKPALLLEYIEIPVYTTAEAGEIITEWGRYGVASERG